jgi:hypothetical protein
VPQITAGEFAAVLTTNGFRVIRAKIEDATGLTGSLPALPVPAHRGYSGASRTAFR